MDKSLYVAHVLSLSFNDGDDDDEDFIAYSYV